MGKFIDLTGMKFGRLKVIKRVPNPKGRALWECKCDCGETAYVETSRLKSGSTKSCGCLHRELLVKRNKETAKYGGVQNERLYGVWHSMKQRCYDHNRKDYQRYGGRGIQVCEQWKSNYNAFKSWCLANGYKQGLQLDRINNDGNYSPGNCRWVTPKENTLNRSTKKIIDVDGKLLNVTQWANLIGVSHQAIDYHIRVGNAEEFIKATASERGVCI